MDASTQAARVKEALDGGDVASVIVPQYGQDDQSFQKRAELLIPLIQDAGAAAIVAGDSRVAGRTRADGLHLSGSATELAEAIEKFAPKLIVGAGGASERHGALEIGEARPDYIYFGRFDGDIKPEAHPKNLALAEWWASMIEIPCIVMGGSDIGSVVPAAETGAEFVALCRARHGLGIDGRMPSKPTMPTSRFCLPVALLFLAASTGIVLAQTSRVVTRPVGGNAVGINQGEQPSGLVPSGGVELYQRMGATLPPAPPEKPYGGPVDEAYGAYQRGLYVTALGKALERAEKGDPSAQTLVAEMMSKGLGIARDTKSAAFWYGQAAERGDPAAMFQYALLLMKGKDVPADKKKADEFMRRAAEAGNSAAQFNWAQILISDNPGDKGQELALPFYEKSARQGVADAQYAVAQLYVALKDVAPEKRAKAREWLKRAAVAGYDTAQLDMGIWFVNGVGGTRDYDKGFEWLRIAARRGNVVAQNKLAHLYVNALGTRPDPVEAAKWYVLSRRAGLQDPELEDFYLGINEEQQKQAIDAANKFQRE
eukprot:g7601.t1